MTTRFDPHDEPSKAPPTPLGAPASGDSDNLFEPAAPVANAQPAPATTANEAPPPSTDAGTPADGDMPLAMPASPAVAADDISQIGVEGKPGDPESGPGLLRLEMIGLIVLFIAIAIGAGMWLGWATGAAVFAWLALAVVFNPVFLATMRRIKDRRLAVQKERQEVVEVRPDLTTTPHVADHGERATPQGH